MVGGDGGGVKLFACQPQLSLYQVELCFGWGFDNTRIFSISTVWFRNGASSASNNFEVVLIFKVIFIFDVF